ncbi:MAG: hypothetical protein OET79_01810 [Nitrospirota bacterium]|nr:hypothetical protein [Nitrospirota bacterium]
MDVAQLVEVYCAAQRGGKLSTFNEGTAKFIDWEIAKADIRKKIS